MAPDAQRAAEYIEGASEVIENEARACNYDREELVGMSALIASHSVSLSWAEVVNSIDQDCTEIGWFYDKARKEMNLE